MEGSLSSRFILSSRGITMRVPQHAPGTWRVRTQSGIDLQSLDLNTRAVACVRAVTDSADKAWTRLRDVSSAVYARLKKARSTTQPPSALARLYEEIKALHDVGVSADRLNIFVVELAAFISSLKGPAAVTRQCVLDAMHAANLATAAEHVAESTMVLHIDPFASIGDIERTRETTRDAIAALQGQLLKLDQYEQQKRAQQPMKVIRGGRA